MDCPIFIIADQRPARVLEWVWVCARALIMDMAKVWGAKGWTSENLLDEHPPTDSDLKATGGVGGDEWKARKEHRDRLAGYAKLAPDAFRAGNAEDREFLHAHGRNWITSPLPAGEYAHCAFRWSSAFLHQLGTG